MNVNYYLNYKYFQTIFRRMKELFEIQSIDQILGNSIRMHFSKKIF